MPKFVIEREIPGAGKMTASQLQEIAQTSCSVLNSMGPSIQWVRDMLQEIKFIVSTMHRMRKW